MRVELEDGELKLYEEQNEEQEKLGALECVFLNGVLAKKTSLTEIRNRLKEEI